MKHLMKFLVAIIIAALLAGCGSAGGSNRPAQQLNPADAWVQVKAYVDNKDVQFTTANYDSTNGKDQDQNWGGDKPAEDLPPLDYSPLSVKAPDGCVSVEIFSSTEKARVGEDTLLNNLAEEFNRSNAMAGGRCAGVSIRPINSGLGYDFITSRTHVPDAYTPSQELWATMIKGSGVRVQEVEKRLAGNTAGILMPRGRYNTFIQQYGSLTMENLMKAVMADELTLAHTDPTQSSTGLNILVQELLALDANNPLSPKTIEAYRQFQAKVPPTANNTKEMAKIAARSQAANKDTAMIMEREAFLSDPNLSKADWVFTPMGVPHNSPLYALGDLSADKMDVLKQFGKFVTSGQHKQLVQSYRFDQPEDQTYAYRGPATQLSASQLKEILKVWKDNKDGGAPVISMVIVDRSGSMAGDRIKQAQGAMRTMANSINPSSYVGMMSYSDDIRLELPIGKFDDAQHSRFIYRVNNLQTGGSTHTNSAIIAALYVMMQYKDVPNARYRIILFTDGKQETDTMHVNRAAEVLKGLGVTLYGVNFQGGVLEELKTLVETNEAGYTTEADGNNVANEMKKLARLQL